MKKIFFIVISVLLLGISLLPSPSEAAVNPGDCSSGCRYSFSLEGKIQGINPASPLSQFNGGTYSTTGYFTSTGALIITHLKIEPSPDGGGGGSGYIAMPDPAG